MNSSPQPMRHTETITLGRNLTDMAKEGLLPPLSLRNNLAIPIAQLLASGDHIVLVGASGVGKTALVESIAQMVAREDRLLPPGLGKRPIFECTAADFQIGCTHVHEFETRMHSIIQKCRQQCGVLFLERMEEAVYAGACEGKEDRTLANLLLPHLGTRMLAVLGTTTPEGYRFMLRRNPQFLERFRRIDVPSMSVEETSALQEGLALRVRRRYDAILDPEALIDAIDLGERFYPWRALPGKAIDLVREAAALTVQSDLSLRERDHVSESPKLPLLMKSTQCSDHITFKRITIRLVREVLLRRCGLPEWMIDPCQPVLRSRLIQLLEQEVYGQRPAVEAVADAMLRFKSGLNDRSRPIAAFLLLGPTGVGKTQLARATARLIFGSEERLLRFDMAEYTSWDAVHTLTGGREVEGRPGLIPEVMAQPFRVILLDEIEKAHPHVQALLLPLLGEGRLTDNSGRTASFANTIIFMTSNVGADLFGRKAVGFGRDKEMPGISESELQGLTQRVFLPEFINRLSSVLLFRPLSNETVLRIAAREVREISGRPGLCRYEVTLEPDGDALNVLASLGYDARYGARQMKRTIEEAVVSPLAERLSAGDVPSHHRVRLIADRGRLRLRLDDIKYVQQTLL